MAVIPIPGYSPAYEAALRTASPTGTRASLSHLPHPVSVGRVLEHYGFPLPDHPAAARPWGHSELYERALQQAIKAHRGQLRKGTGIPYITHPVHVSLILLQHGFSAEAVTAGLLHDAVEDAGTDPAGVADDLGPAVAEIVAALSEQKMDVHGRRRPWAVRKRESLEQLRQAGTEAVAVKAADVLHNLCTMVVDLKQNGEVFWERFNAPAQSILAYNQQLFRVVRQRLGEPPIVEEMEEALREFSAAIELGR